MPLYTGGYFVSPNSQPRGLGMLKITPPEKMFVTGSGYEAGLVAIGQEGGLMDFSWLGSQKPAQPAHCRLSASHPNPGAPEVGTREAA